MTAAVSGAKGGEQGLSAASDHSNHRAAELACRTRSLKIVSRMREKKKRKKKHLGSVHQKSESLSLVNTFLVAWGALSSIAANAE